MSSGSPLCSDLVLQITAWHTGEEISHWSKMTQALLFRPLPNPPHTDTCSPYNPMPECLSSLIRRAGAGGLLLGTPGP